MFENRKPHFKILSSVLSNISAGALLLPLTISITTGNLHFGSLTISLILAIIYYGFAVRVESLLEEI